MTLKHVTILICLSLMTAMTQITSAETNAPQMDHMAHHNMISTIDDERISLGLSAKMKQHQLANMRSHVEAVQTIVGYISEGKFESASTIAHEKLGLTNEMSNMCKMIDNDEFIKIGLSFHKSGDDLGDALLTEDTNLSLKALHTTMGYCVQCHATFRQ